MADAQSDTMLRSFRTLLSVGTIADLTDEQLLERFVSRRDETADLIFEALVTRHGRMVLDVCRNVLKDSHDAQDAFQTTFLILARKARTIRRRQSLASWLFGVARRVALRAKCEAARRHTLERKAAELSSQEESRDVEPPDASALYEAVNSLPEKYRTPVVLCYLEGMTYEAAAQHLQCPLGTLSIRLKRARERIKSRLLRNGSTIPSGFAVAGLAREPLTTVPPDLLLSAVRTATSPSLVSGGLTGTTSSNIHVLTRGVLQSMFFHRLRLITLPLTLVVIVGFWAWRESSAQIDDKGGGATAQKSVPTAKGPGQLQAPDPKPLTTPKDGATTNYRLAGSVRLEGSGEPVPGATVEVMLSDSGKNHRGEIKAARSGPDGQYIIELPPGNSRTWQIHPPAGYLPPKGLRLLEPFVVTTEEPLHRKDYLVRRGTVWSLLITQSSNTQPIDGNVAARIGNETFEAVPDEKTKQLQLTLPIEAGKTSGIFDYETRARIPVTLEWESGFRPDAVKSVSVAAGSSQRFRLQDDVGRTATVESSGKLDPVLHEGKLLIHVKLPEPEPKPPSELIGQVIDAKSAPIAGAQVALVYASKNGSGMSGLQATTDAEGRYRIPSIPHDADPAENPKLMLVVTKDGYAGIDSRPFAFQPGKTGIHVADPIRLEPEVALNGIVVDPDGRPVPGAWIEPSGSYAERSEFVRTDAKPGLFTNSLGDRRKFAALGRLWPILPKQ